MHTSAQSQCQKVASALGCAPADAGRWTVLRRALVCLSLCCFTQTDYSFHCCSLLLPLPFLFLLLHLFALPSSPFLLLALTLSLPSFFTIFLPSLACWLVGLPFVAGS